jgi:hypothetical protein
MKDRRLFWILLPILLGVWGMIVYRFNAAMDEPENGAPSSLGRGINRASTQGSQNEDAPFVYTVGGRDPFLYQPPKPKVIPRPVAIVEPPWEPPPLRLTGILGVKKKKTAVIEDTSGSTYLLQKGDTLAGVTILAIAETKVEYRYKKKHALWTLAPDGQ